MVETPSALDFNTVDPQYIDTNAPIIEGFSQADVALCRLYVTHRALYNSDKDMLPLFEIDGKVVSQQRFARIKARWRDGGLMAQIVDEIVKEHASDLDVAISDVVKQGGALIGEMMNIALKDKSGYNRHQAISWLWEQIITPATTDLERPTPAEYAYLESADMTDPTYIPDIKTVTIAPQNDSVPGLREGE